MGKRPDSEVETESRKVRVVYLGHTAQLSGAEIALTTLLPALCYVDSVVVLAEHGPLVEALAERGVKVLVVPMPGRTSALRMQRVTARKLPAKAVVDAIAYALRLARLLKRLGPDLVHTNSAKAHLYGSLAARVAGVPQVWHARDLVTGDLYPGLAVWILRAGVRFLPRLVIANSHATLASLHLPEGRGPLRTVIDNAVDLPHGSRTRHSHRPLRVGIVGRLAPWKGQDVFLRAFARAGSQVSAQAIVVGGALFGEDDYAAQLKDLSQELGIETRVQFTGHVQDVQAQLREMDILVHASTVPEPFGKVIVEGMSAGLPVVATAAGGPLEIVDSEVNGLLVPPGDVEAMAHAMERLMASPELRKRLGEAGRERSLRYSPERIAAEVEQWYAVAVP